MRYVSTSMSSWVVHAHSRASATCCEATWGSPPTDAHNCAYLSAAGSGGSSVDMGRTSIPVKAPASASLTASGAALIPGWNSPDNCAPTLRRHLLLSPVSTALGGGLPEDAGRTNAGPTLPSKARDQRKRVGMP